MNDIQHNIHTILKHIHTFESKFEREHNSVRLLAVSKTKPIEAIEQAVAAGQYAFGENYVQEGVEKAHHFNRHYNGKNIEWHFIGPIQSNKTRSIAENFSWVHSIDRAKIAQRLDAQRPDKLPPLQVLIQVNTSQEASKSGVMPEQVIELAQLIDSLPNLVLRGLMSIPEATKDRQQQLLAFKQLKDLKDTLSATINTIDTLSMGMSADMEAAIEAGSTMVRIGSAIFGARDYSKQV